ncbi:MAG TPA: PadR family transcriptional regulator [Solirubrobacteraceae bacterium]|nr:PadR family transcriptional regulator [Solirubrobacteraceae bacterium]
MPRLTPVSYMVLGLIENAGEATPYQLKAFAAQSVGNFWSIQHAQLYTESERLAKAGLLDEHREEGGRRRRTYALTEAGRAALAEWRAAPATELGELRSLGLLQLFFGAEKGPLARAQLESHGRKLAEYEQLHAAAADWLPEGQRLALEAGIAHEREWLRFWRAVGDNQS